VGDPQDRRYRSRTRERFQPWAQFLRSPADAVVACEFFETATLTGTRLYVVAVIEHAHRRIRSLGATAHSTAAWVRQAAATWSWTSTTLASGRGSRSDWAGILNEYQDAA
jgi:hypothetical protein